MDASVRSRIWGPQFVGGSEHAPGFAGHRRQRSADHCQRRPQRAHLYLGHSSRLTDLVDVALTRLLNESVSSPSLLRSVARVCRIALTAEGWTVDRMLRDSRQRKWQVTWRRCSAEESHATTKTSKFESENSAELWNDAVTHKSPAEIVELYKELGRRMQAEELRQFSRPPPSPRREVTMILRQAIAGKVRHAGSDVHELIEPLLPILRVDKHREAFLVDHVQTAVENFAATAEAEQNAPRSLFPFTVLLCRLQKLRGKWAIDRTPSGLLPCVNCKDVLADFGCAVCHDFLCYKCFYRIHESGNRQDHPAVFFEQPICSECQDSRADVRCDPCGDLFCFRCFSIVHHSLVMARHSVHLVDVPDCCQCTSRPVAVRCVECEDLLCSFCWEELHKHGSRQNHTRDALDDVGSAPSMSHTHVAQLLLEFPIFFVNKNA
eukprot:GHVT01070109.1.p1 GENE.GHVT01070109.1~~GHVT01070109.1.p1  ORF type:complete len:435 (+),score=26.16 GHVT01070109.1:381-1685(+)